MSNYISGKQLVMIHTYRETRAALIRRYHWPAREDPRYKDLEAQSWDDIRRVLLEFIDAWMTTAHVHSVGFEGILAAQAGPEWWKDEAVRAVEEFLSGI